MADPDSSSSSSTALGSGTSPASLTSTAPVATTPSASSTTPLLLFLFGTNPSLFQGTSPSSGSQFAPLFTLAPPAPSPPAPRHPIYSDHITNHIKFLLNPAEHNYHKWKSFFLLVLIRYGVLFLIEHPPPPNADASYLELDALVVLWIYATRADPMVDHVVGATTTFALWKKIKDFFLANQAARFMVLNRQYRNLKQGDLSVSEYACRLKLLTDGLADIDHVVTEIDLTTQFLHGFDKRIDTIRVILGDQDLPFDTVLSRVVLAEESQAQRAAEESASAIAFPSGDHGPDSSSGAGARGSGDHGGSSDRPASDCAQGSPHPHHQPPGRGRGDRSTDGDRDRGRGRGCGHGRDDSAGRGQPSQPLLSPFTGYFALYSMALPLPRSGLVPPNAASVLGPRLGAHAQAYTMYPSAPSTPYYPPQQPSWEHLAMLNAAFGNSGINTQPALKWYLDSGASSHVTGTQGSSHSESSHDLR